MVEARIVGWASWPSGDTVEAKSEALLAMAKQVENIVGLKSHYAGQQHQRGNKWNVVQITGCLRNGTPVIGRLRLSSVPLLAQGRTASNEEYLEVDLTVRGQVTVREWVDCWQRIASLNPRLKLETHLYFSGKIPGKVAKLWLHRRTQNMLAVARACLVEYAENPAWMSVSAYSRALPRAVYCGGKLLNLGIAWRYHSADNFTYLTLGIPVLPGEF